MYDAELMEEYLSNPESIEDLIKLVTGVFLDSYAVVYRKVYEQKFLEQGKSSTEIMRISESAVTNPYEYFTQGGCFYFANVIRDILTPEYATVYCTMEHAAIKVGDKLYDVRGEIPAEKVPEFWKAREIDEAMMNLTFGFLDVNGNDIDQVVRDEVLNIMTATGREQVRFELERLKQKANEEPKMGR